MRTKNLTIRRIFNYVFILSLTVFIPQIADASILENVNERIGSAKSSIVEFLDIAKQGAEMQVRSLGLSASNSFTDISKTIQPASVASSIDGVLQKAFGFAIDKTTNLFSSFLIDKEAVLLQDVYTVESVTQTNVSANNTKPQTSKKNVDSTKSNQSPTFNFNTSIIQDLTRRIFALENRKSISTSGTASGTGANVINQYITNNYISSGGGYSYSFPADTTSQTNTLISNAVTPLQQQITALGTGGGSGNATNTSAYILATSTSATSTFSGNVSIGGNTEVSGSIRAGTFYGDGSNLTGISASTFSTSSTRNALSAGSNLLYDVVNGVFSFASSTARGMFSSSAIGLTYTAGTGDFSITSGYTIPLTASTTEWANTVTTVAGLNTSVSTLGASTTNISTFFQTPSTRISAGTGLSWSGNTLNNTGVTSVTGDWTGTFDGQDSPFYLSRTNHTGTQLSSTISDFNTAVDARVSLGLNSLNASNIDSGILAIARGGTGTTTAPTFGQLLMGNASGGYDLVATSTLGITSGGSGTVNSGLAGQVAFYNSDGTAVSGTSTLFFANGNVGVGSTSPIADFSVQGKAFVGAGRKLLSVVGAISSGSGGGIDLITGSGGNVNIRTQPTISAGSGSINLMTDDGDEYGGAINMTAGSGFSAGGSFQLTGGNTTGDPFERGGSITLNPGSGMSVGQDGYINIASTRGYIGIGTTAVSSARLTVNGLASAASILNIASSTGTTFFSFQSNGRFGIGTTTPSAKLAVTGTAGTDDIFNIASSTNASLFKITSTGATYFNNSAGTLGMVLLSNGTGASPTWVATSSLGISGGGGSGTVNSGLAGQVAFYNSDGTAVSGTSTLSFSNGNLTTSGLLNINGTGTSTILSNILISGNITPSADITYDLGSPDKQWKDVYIGPGSLYINGQKVLQEESQSIVVTADINQNLIFRTAGTGDLELNPTGTGLIQLKGNVQLSGGYDISTSNNTSVSFSDGILPGNIKISGNKIVPTNTNGSLELSATGTGAVYVGTGNFGIGTTTPSYPLTVAGDANITGALRFNGSSGTAGMVLLSNGSSAPTWVATSSLGMLSSTISDFNTAVDARVSLGLNSLNASNIDSGILAIARGGTGTTTAPTFGQLLMGNASGGYDLVATSTLGISGGGSSQWTTTGSNIYYATGDVGIGTSTSPSQRLALYEASGDIKIGFSDSSATKFILGTDSANNKNFNISSGSTFGTGNDVLTILSNTVPATSYANSGGTGARSGVITVTDSGSLFSGGSGANLIDGSMGLSAYFNSSSASGKWIQFDFGSSQLIDEAKWYQTAAFSNGTWKWQGSNNASSWSDIGASFTLGGATTQTHTTLNGNSTSYRYYRLLGVSGTVTTWTSGYELEIEFKIASYSGGQSYLGIHNASPNAALDIKGWGAAGGYVLRARNSSGTDLFSVLDSGNVGIGTSTPMQALSVSGTINATNLLGGSTNLTVDANGNIIRDPSDENLKENIVTLENSLSKIMKLRGVRYEWKDKERFGSSTEIGVIAQEVELVVPEVVSSGGIYKSVNIKNLVGLLIEGVKELKNKLDAFAEWFSNDGTRLNVQGMICVDDVCVSKDQFKQMLINSGSVTIVPPAINTVSTDTNDSNSNSSSTSTTENVTENSPSPTESSSGESTNPEPVVTDTIPEPTPEPVVSSEPTTTSSPETVPPTNE